MIRRGLGIALLTASLAAASGLSITTGSNLGTFPIGYDQISLNASGGTGNYIWGLTSGVLPPGLNIAAIPGSLPSQIGLVGIATQPGNYSFTLGLSDGVTNLSQAFTLKITELTLKDVGLPDSFVNTEFSYTFTPLNYAGAVTFTATSPALPAGVTLSSGGVLSGMPTTAGNYQINFKISDGVDTVFRGDQLSVYAVDISTPGALPNATIGASYSTTLVATGGTGGYAYSLTGGGLPNGLSMSASGAITGTITSAGTGLYGFDVTVSDSSNNSYQKTMSIDVLSGTVEQTQVTLGTIDDAVVGNSYGWQIPICCGGKAPFTWTAAGLPPGMSIRYGSGVTSDYIYPGFGEIWGVPSVAGNYTVTVTVTDSLGASSSLTFPFHVSVLSLGQNYNLPNGTLNIPYSNTFEIEGGTPPYTVVQVPQVNGFLPDGLSLNTAAEAAGYFTVAGTPIENGSFDPIFKITDSLGNTLTRNNYFNINTVVGGITINDSAMLYTLTAGSSLSAQLSACCVANYVWSAPNGLPTGVSISSSGLLSGSISTPGTYTFLIKAADAAGVAAPGFRQFTVLVTPIVISTNSLPYANVGAAYSTSFAATGGTGTLSWSVAFGYYLPPGLTLASNGTLSGTPTLTGQFYFGVTVTDQGNRTAIQYFNMNVYASGQAPPVSIGFGPNIGAFLLGTEYIQLSANGGNGTYTWTLVSGALPPGLALRTDVPASFPLNSQAGLIGVATTPGNYNFTLMVSSGGSTATQAITMRVTALTLQDATPPDGFVTTPFRYAFTPINNAGAVTFTVNSNSTNGTMPPGLTLSSAGVLSGTPTAAGNYTVAMTISDGVDTVYQQYELYIYAINITGSAILPNATQNTAYSAALAATGGAGGYTFTTSGLPGGLTLASNGVISGNAGSDGPGLYGFTVTVTDSANNSYTKRMGLDILASPSVPMRISGLVNNDPTVGDHVGIVQTVCCGGVAPFTWVVTGLPPGMAYAPSDTSFNNYSANPGGAQIYGVPNAAGTYNVTYTATDATGASTSLTIPMHVSVLDVALASGSAYGLPSGTIGVPYSAAFHVIGGAGPYSFTQASIGELPDGLTINSGALTVSGTPLENGSNFNAPGFEYADSAGNTLFRYEGISISGGASNIQINSSGYNGYYLGTTPVNVAYSTQFSACCANSYVWSVAAGSILPPGLSLSSSGQLAGTPTKSGTYTFLLDAANSSSLSDVGVKSFVLVVTPISFTTSSLPYGDVGVPYSVALIATGGTGTLTWTQTLLQSSQLPPGLSLSSTGTISGTPTSAGSFDVNILVTDASGNTAIRTFVIIIALPAAFFTGQISLGSGVEYLQFPNGVLFGYYSFLSGSIFYHFDMGYEAFVPGSASDIYLYDFTSGHWWYTSNTLFPYLYDFTLKAWIYYFPNTQSPGHYTTNPRYFDNLTTNVVFTM